MKYLSHYLEEPTTALFNKYGVFFAFSQKQFDEQKKENTKYVKLPTGAICPKEHAEAFLREYDQIVDQAIAIDLNENGREGVINRELNNHECYYTGDIESCVDALKDYGITEAEILDQFRKGSG